MPDIPPSDEERRLLDAIAADPEGDAPRLAYADWVEARDPERAELVRLSIDLERRRPKPDWNDPIRVWHRQLEAWFVQKVRDEGADEVVFERGFVRWLSLPTSISPERAAALFEASPALRNLCLLVDGSHAESLAALPHLSRLRGLRVCLRAGGSQQDDGRLADLIASPHLTSLRSLSFEGVVVGPITARAIAEAPAFAALEDLCFRGVRSFASRAAAALADRLRLGTVRNLEISNCVVDAEGWAALAATRFLAGVTSLTLDGSWVRDDGARALAGAPLGACTKLGLKEALIGDAGAVALAGSAAFESLVEMDLTHNHVGDEGAKAFAASPHLPRLKRLLLQYNSVGEAGAEALAATDRLPSLELLGLYGNAIYTDEIEQWTDWDGTPVGSGPVRVSFHEIRARYERRFKID